MCVARRKRPTGETRIAFTGPTNARFAFAIVVHGANLENGIGAAAPAESRLRVKNGAARRQFDGDGGQQKERKS